MSLMFAITLVAAAVAVIGTALVWHNLPNRQSSPVPPDKQPHIKITHDGDPWHNMPWHWDIIDASGQRLDSGYTYFRSTAIRTARRNARRYRKRLQRRARPPEHLPL